MAYNIFCINLLHDSEGNKNGKTNKLARKFWKGRFKFEARKNNFFFLFLCKPSFSNMYMYGLIKFSSKDMLREKKMKKGDHLNIKKGRLMLLVHCTLSQCPSSLYEVVFFKNTSNTFQVILRTISCDGS